MPRPKGYTRAVAARRATAENAAACLAEAKTILPITRLRITQTMQRTGLTAILQPALDELAAIERAIQQAQALIVNLGEQQK